MPTIYRQQHNTLTSLVSPAGGQGQAGPSRPARWIWVHPPADSLQSCCCCCCPHHCQPHCQCHRPRHQLHCPSLNFLSFHDNSGYKEERNSYQIKFLESITSSYNFNPYFLQLPKTFLNLLLIMLHTHPKEKCEGHSNSHQLLFLLYGTFYAISSYAPT